MATERECGTVARALDENMESRSHHSLGYIHNLFSLIPRVTATMRGVVQAPGAVPAGACSQPLPTLSCAILFILLVPAPSPGPGAQDGSAKLERETPPKCSRFHPSSPLGLLTKEERDISLAIRPSGSQRAGPGSAACPGKGV